jgi:hypothetical protein
MSCPHQSRNGAARNPFRLYEKDSFMIRKLASGKYRLYSSKKDPKTGKRRNLGTFNSRAAAQVSPSGVRIASASIRCRYGPAASPMQAPSARWGRLGLQSLLH